MSKDTEQYLGQPIVKDVKKGALYIGDIKGDTIPIKAPYPAIWPVPAQIKFKATIKDANPPVTLWESDYTSEVDSIAEIPKDLFPSQMHKIVIFTYCVESSREEVESDGLEARILEYQKNA